MQKTNPDEASILGKKNKHFKQKIDEKLKIVQLFYVQIKYFCICN